ncbi:MAG: hypothetical protein KC621_03965 [Myxococcales bacterium]|nr:hypothetical protein [Myxococcales bacterium]
MIALTLFLGAVAFGYDSVCHDPTGAVCAAGPATASPEANWSTDSSEHRDLFDQTMALAGLPAELRQPFELPSFVPARGLNPPAFADAARVVERGRLIAEFAQLPDFSYSLWDWASGNETCPILAGEDAATCHLFEQHMGAVNSNHFLPQAQDFYGHYHALALARAAECKAMADALGPSHAEYPRACEVEALILESVGHHYLQDAWSAGHMWERWGSPDLADMPGRPAALAAAMTSGLIHGARAVLEAELGSFGTFDDPLCAPHPDVTWVLGDGTRGPGLGDLYLDRLEEPAFSEQHGHLYGCAVAGLLEVYEAAGQQHGPASPAPGLRSFDPTSNDCFGQRVTNQAFRRAFGIDFVDFTGTARHIELSPEIAGQLVFRAATSIADEPLDARQLALYRHDLARVAAMSTLYNQIDPTATDLATGGAGSLIGIEPNGAFRKTPVSSYVDPALPWSTAATDDRQRPLTRLFHRAHADDWCRTTTLADLEALREGALGQDEVGCKTCVEFARRHVRPGEPGEDTYDPEPVCALLNPNAALVYQAGATGDSTALAEQWCGCPADVDVIRYDLTMEPCLGSSIDVEYEVGLHLDLFDTVRVVDPGFVRSVYSGTDPCYRREQTGQFATDLAPTVGTNSVTLISRTTKAASECAADGTLLPAEYTYDNVGLTLAVASGPRSPDGAFDFNYTHELVFTDGCVATETYSGSLTPRP